MFLGVIDIFVNYSAFRDSETPGALSPPGTLMILKSACSNNPSYIDRLISVFMRSLQKMVHEHLSPQAASGSTEAASGEALGRATAIGSSTAPCFRVHHHLLSTERL